MGLTIKSLANAELARFWSMAFQPCKITNQIAEKILLIIHISSPDSDFAPVRRKFS